MRKKVVSEADCRAVTEVLEALLPRLDFAIPAHALVGGEWLRLVNMVGAAYYASRMREAALVEDMYAFYIECGHCRQDALERLVSVMATDLGLFTRVVPILDRLRSRG